MPSQYHKTHVIRCVDCGKKRRVYAPNWDQVKRCVKHTYEKRQRDNTEYVRLWRKKQKGIKK